MSKNNKIFGESSEPNIMSKPSIRTRLIPYNQGARKNNFFTSESPLITAGAQIVNGGNIVNAPNTLRERGKYDEDKFRNSDNETKESLNQRERNSDTVARRSSQGFSIKRPKPGDMDFDYGTMNTNLKIRDLESKFIDLKGDMERKILQLIEENPMKMMQQLKHVEEKETEMWAENINKHHKNSEALTLYQAKQGNQLDQFKNIITQMQHKLEDLTYKNVELERGISSLNKKNTQIVDSSFNAIEHKQSTGREIFDLATEVRMIKDRIGNGENNKMAIHNEYQKQIDSLNNIILKNENEFYNRLRDQKKQILEEIGQNKMQVKRLEEVRMEKMLGDNEYVKGMVDSLEKRIRAEMQKRLNSDYDLKSWLEMQMQNVKDEMKNDQRDVLENQNNFVKEVQETISSMNQILKNTREEFSTTSNSNQLLTTENLRNLTKAIEVVKENTFEKMGAIDQNMISLNNKLQDATAAMNSNSTDIGQTLENEFTRMDKILKKYEGAMTTSVKNMNDRIAASEIKYENWRTETDSKNQSIFKEITNVIKNLKKQIIKVDNDSKERDKLLQKELTDQKKLNTSMFKSIDDKVVHLEEIYNFKLTEQTKVWENNLQIEVDKILDAISKNSESLTNDYVKKLHDQKLELQKQLFDNIDQT